MNVTSLGHRHTNLRARLLPGLLASSLALIPTAVHAMADAANDASAQKPQEVQTADIIVTATRQSQLSQRVPLSLTAVGSKQLAQQGITNASQLNQVSPSLYVLGTVSEGSPRFSLRGLTFTDTQATGSPAVATYIDDVYQSFQLGMYTTLFDIQRVEVLRGPQGTTFGRNTTGGAVAYFDQTPTNKFEGYISGRVAAGDQGQQYVEGVLNVPLVDDKLAIRFSGHSEWHDNYVHDTTTGLLRGASNSQTGRFQIRYTPDDLTSVNLTVAAVRRRGDTAVAHVDFGTGFDPNYTTLSPNNLFDQFDNQAVTLRIEHSFGLFDLTSITHYRHTSYGTSQDLDGFYNGTPATDILYRDQSRAVQYGQEVRLSSDQNKRISGLIGLYYEHDRVSDHIAYASTSYGIGSDYNTDIPYVLKTNAYAAFANLKIKLTDSLSILGGVRKSIEKKTDVGSANYYFNFDYDWTENNMLVNGASPVPPSSISPYSLRQESKPWTWDATINYNPSSELLVYARVAKGFRSGGFNAAPQLPSFDPTVSNILPPYAGEEVMSYEGGFKIGLLDNKLRVNASGYHYDYTNQQVTDYPAGQAFTSNAGRSKIDGGELEITALPAPGLDLRGSLSYTDARYTDFPTATGVNLKGNHLQEAPKWTLNASANYLIPIDQHFNLNLNTTWSHRSTIYFDTANSPELRSGPVTKGNFRISLDPPSGKGFSVAAFVNNVTNRRPLSSGYPYALDFVVGPFYTVKFVETGRLFGVDMGYHW